jgi:hypothetical protein
MGMINRPGMPLTTHEAEAARLDEEARAESVAQREEARARRDAARDARGLVSDLLAAETTHPAPDGRRVLRGVRMHLQTAVDDPRVTADELSAQAMRSRETLDMWAEVQS